MGGRLHDENDLISWRQRSEALADITDRYALFTEFAAIEVSFELLERRAREAVEDIEDGMQTQLDAYRGK